MFQTAMSSSMILILILSMLLNTGVSVNFTDVFESSWSPDHIAVLGDQVTLTLDSASSKISFIHFIYFLTLLPIQGNIIMNHLINYVLIHQGCGFESKIKYLFGKASAQIKLVEGDSSGTVVAFYVRDENYAK